MHLGHDGERDAFGGHCADVDSDRAAQPLPQSLARGAQLAQDALPARGRSEQPHEGRRAGLAQGA